MADLKTEASFVFFSSAKVLLEFRETFAEECCHFDGRSIRLKFIYGLFLRAIRTFFKLVRK